MHNIIIFILNKEMPLMEAYNCCNKILLCGEPENIAMTPQELSKAVTTMNTSEMERGESVYLASLYLKSSLAIQLSHFFLKLLGLIAHLNCYFVYAKFQKQDVLHYPFYSKASLNYVQRHRLNLQVPHCQFAYRH